MDLSPPRRYLHHNSKFRKYSLPTEVTDPVSASRRRHHHHHHHHHDKSDAHFYEKRRVSTQPEDLPLKDADRDQLDSHRSDDSKALRRQKISRPSNASMVFVGKNDVGEPYTITNRTYDHSPHAVRVWFFFNSQIFEIIPNLNRMIDGIFWKL